MALSLTLPDICAQVENGIKESNRSYYIDWVNNHMNAEDYHFPIPEFETQTFTGEMCYSLRCKVLHNGNTDVSNQKLNVLIDDFVLLRPGDPDYYHGYRYEQKKGTNNANILKTYIGVDYLCETICEAVELFYNGWPNKTDFDNHYVWRK